MHFWAICNSIPFLRFYFSLLFSPSPYFISLVFLCLLGGWREKKDRSINNCNHYYRQINGLWISKENSFISLQICLHIWWQRPFWTLSYVSFKRSNKKIRGNIFFSFHSWKNKNQEWTEKKKKKERMDRMPAHVIQLVGGWTKTKPRISESQFCVFTLWHMALP